MKDSPRPELGFPGAWLDVNKTMFHLMDYQAPEHLDPWHRRTESRSMVDHIALKAQGFDEMRKKLVEMGADWRQINLEHAGLWQLFVLDPNGVVIEMNFDIAAEPAGSKDPDGENPYVIVESYLDGHAGTAASRGKTTKTVTSGKPSERTAGKKKQAATSETSSSRGTGGR
ncbi:MAG: hypothetical protein FJY55_11640 [Betaproteobacteria bacterium]|nr:hypothetical protein [Betaproteobacteria bacterium]